MDPLASHPTSIPVTLFQQNYRDSNSCSSCSPPNDTSGSPLPPIPGAKLRLMCSYGGHIIPRPHDKSLCYVGGDTRIVVVDRQSSLCDLHTRLSNTLLNGNKFTLKYQLPNEDFDSLVSVTTYKDLEHMIEEYDRTMLASHKLKSCRLRLFLFLDKIETAASMGSLLDDVKSGTWFVNNADLLSRGLSDSAAVDNLLELYNIPENDNSLVNSIKQVHSGMSDSLLSSISSHSMGSMPPIAVTVKDNHTNSTLQDQILGLDERFSNISIASNEQKLDNGEGEHYSPVIFVDEKTDNGSPTRLRKPPLRQLSIKRRNGDGCSLPSPDSRRAGGDSNLPAPDSVASESIASAVSMICQDATLVRSPENRVPFTVIDLKNNIMDPNSQTRMQQVQDSSVIPPPQQKTQFIPGSAHYIQHTATGPVRTPSYYPVYAPPSQQPMHQQYQMIFVPVPQITMQPNIADATAVASSKHLNTPMVSSSTAYREAIPHIYPTKTVTSSKPETTANLYRTATPRGVQVLSSQFQQQYYGLSPASRPQAAVSPANSRYEYSHPTHDQMYYAQHPAPPLPSQATAVLFSQASAQLAAENTPSQNITS